MSIQIKKIGKREYAYLAYRSGNKVVQKYIGPASDPKVASRMRLLGSEKTVPEKLRLLFWDTDLHTLGTSQYSTYIIERILELGDMEAWEWLQLTYSGRAILKVLETGRRISPKSKNFWRIWYGIHNAH